MKGICILGASGSVGESALRVMEKFPDRFHLVSFSVHSNIERAKSIIDSFHPELLCITSDTPDKSLGDKYRNTRILYGSESMSEAVSLAKVDLVLTAVVGSVGIMPTVQAIQSGKILAIANKETLVTFGPYINSLLAKYQTRVLPVDSEHNALFQLLENRKDSTVTSLALTASGGALRDYPLEKLSSVTVEEALAHPTWKMGPKITIDSAGLVNKGLEIIEAHFLFHVPYENIEVVIHPQSIIHGLVGLRDGAYLAYASHPDMIYPISHSFFYPDDIPDPLAVSKPWDWKNLEFIKPDARRYPALKLAFQAGMAGGIAPAVFNAANEVAVESFLNRGIGFLQISEVIEECLQQTSVTYPVDLQEFLDADNGARALASDIISGRLEKQC